MPDERAQRPDDRKPLSEDVTAYLPRAAFPPKQAPHTRSIPLGSTLGKYRIDAVLGRGGGGEVYAAEDTQIKRRVAIKMLPPGVADDPALLARFRAEARSAGRLNHPHVVTIYEILEVDGYHAIVMELLTGGSMQEYLTRKGSPGWRVSTKLAGEACKALIAAHEAGLIHRDIKPANLLLTKDGHVKVADFGLAKIEAADASMHTQAGAILGTPAFMSPEQCRGDKIDHRTDIYSLGCTYFAMLTGKPPFEAASSMQVMFSHCSAPIPNPCELNADTPQACAEVLNKALAKDPNQRYPNARAMFKDLQAILGAGPSANVSQITLMDRDALSKLRGDEPSGSRVSSFVRPQNYKVAIGGALVVLIVGVALATWMLHRGAGVKESKPESAATLPITRPAEIAKTFPAMQPVPIPSPSAAAPVATVAAIPSVFTRPQEPNPSIAIAPAATRPVVAGAAPSVSIPAPMIAPASQPVAAMEPVSHVGPAPAKVVYDAERLKALPPKMTNSIHQELVLIRPGKFIMGDVAFLDAPRHEVTITKPLYMAVCEVTQGEFAQVLGNETGEHMHRKDLPAPFVTWDEAVKFCQMLNDLPEEKTAGRVYRLPTEAEWEYACRAGTKTRYAFGNTLDRQHANFGKSIDLAAQRPAENGADTPPEPPPREPPDIPGPPNQRGNRPQLPGQRVDPRTQHPLEPVGQYPANEWGLKDMHGSVWEWCSDFYAANGYRSGPQTDPTGPEKGKNHVARGGCWASAAEQCASGYRNGRLEPNAREPLFGFRVVCDVAP